MIRRDWLLVGLLSVTVIALELIWTRLFSAEFYYTFAFLVLSLAVMGLGIGALATRLFPFVRRPAGLGWILTLAACAAIVGPPLVFRLGLDLSTLFASWKTVGRLLVAVTALGSAFFFAGMALALIFRDRPRDMPRLYMSDLLGAAAGVVVAVILMNGTGTSAAAFLCVLPVLFAAWLASKGWGRIAPVALLAGVVALVPLAPGLLEVEREERGPVIYKHWDAMSKIKVYGYGDEYRSINIDNIANTGTYGFDGDWDRLASEPFEFGIDVGNLTRRFESCTFLSLGAGGGADVLQALQYGATEVRAVEVNPHLNRMLLEGDPSGYLSAGLIEERGFVEEMLRQREAEAAAEAAETEAAPEGEPAATDGDSPAGDGPDPAGEGAETTAGPDPAPPSVVTFPDFSGRLYHDPRVRVVTEDARAYVARHPGEFDVIYSLSSNTFSALASGSFALAENYLFTTEAFRDYWRALASDGFMMMEHQFYMPRLVAGLIDALEEMGVENSRDHFAVYDLPKMRRNMILLSRRPLTDEIRNAAFGELTPDRWDDIHLLHPAPESLDGNLIERIVIDGWEAAAADAPIDISPTTDDRPFVGQMGLWRNLGREEGPGRLAMLEVTGYPLSKIMIVAILVTVAVLLVPLNLLPYLQRNRPLRAAPWLYFFAIGAAFMAVEVVLIQKYTLFVGPSVFSIATILLALLVSSAVGSRFSGTMPDRIAFAGVAGLLIADAVVSPWVVGALAGLGMTSRIVVTALLVAPLGFFMGMPFPKAAVRVGERVDWAFAVNGAASVLGASGVLLVAFEWGFRAALLGAALLYLVAFGLFSIKRSWPASSTEADVAGPA